MSNRSVASRYVLMMDEGRTARVCSAYEKRQRPRVEIKVRAAAASVVRVRAADGATAQRINAASCSAPKTVQADYTINKHGLSVKL
jgi:hypothetical protein